MGLSKVGEHLVGVGLIVEQRLHELQPMTCVIDDIGPGEDGDTDALRAADPPVRRPWVPALTIGHTADLARNDDELPLNVPDVKAGVVGDGISVSADLSRLLIADRHLRGLQLDNQVLAPVPPLGERTGEYQINDGAGPLGVEDFAGNVFG